MLHIRGPILYDKDNFSDLDTKSPAGSPLVACTYRTFSAINGKQTPDGFPCLAQALLNELRTGGARVFTLQYHLDGEGWEATKTCDESSIRLYPAIEL